MLYIRSFIMKNFKTAIAAVAVVVLLLPGCERKPNLIEPTNPGNGLPEDKYTSASWDAAVSDSTLPSKALHAACELNGLLWISAGWDGVQRKSDVWYSVNGINWIAANDVYGMSARTGHAMTAFNRKMWIIGGFDGTNYLADTLSSIDGVNWEKVTRSAAFGPRAGHTLTVYKNVLWLIGGSNAAGDLNDAWWSADGVNWVRASDKLAIGSKNGHKTAVYNERLWVVGLNDKNKNKKYTPVSYTEDGINWVTVTQDAGLKGELSAFFNYGNVLYVIGSRCAGSSTNVFSEIWSSTDGKTWEQKQLKEPVDVKCGALPVLFNNKVIFTGGY